MSNRGKTEIVSPPVLGGKSTRPEKFHLKNTFIRTSFSEQFCCVPASCDPRVTEKQRKGCVNSSKFWIWGLHLGPPTKGFRDTIATGIAGKEKAYTALLQCRTSLCRKKNGVHRGKIWVVDMVFLVFIGFLYPPPLWKVFL